MQRIVNDPTMVVEDMLGGFVRAHEDIVSATSNPRVVRYIHAPERGRVGVVTGGGSGHEPAFIGYVGWHMLDAVAVGEVFSSPSAQAFHDAFKAADGGAGVACLYGNFAGDNMNVGIARRLAEESGVRTMTVVANDDTASALPGERARRRGSAGEILMWKVGAAKAALGGSLDEVVTAAQKAVDNTRSVGIGLTPCTIPAVGKPNFEIAPGTMELGIGHHGEPGIRVVGLTSARDIAQTMLDSVVPDLPFREGDAIALLVSGMGATPLMELYILFGQLADALHSAGLTVRRTFVGNLFTSLDMMGATMTLMRLDDELEACLDLPAESVGLRRLMG